MKIIEILNNYNYHKQEEKKHKAEARKLNNKLKEILRNREEKTLKGDGFSVEYYTSTRKKVNEDKLLGLFKRRGLEDYIEHKEVVSEDIAIELIKEGKLNSNDLMNVIETKEIENIRLREE